MLTTKKQAYVTENDLDCHCIDSFRMEKEVIDSRKGINDVRRLHLALSFHERTDAYHS